MYLGVALTTAVTVPAFSPEIRSVVRFVGGASAVAAVRGLSGKVGAASGMGVGGDASGSSWDAVIMAGGSGGGNTAVFSMGGCLATTLDFFTTGFALNACFTGIGGSDAGGAGKDRMVGGWDGGRPTSRMVITCALGAMDS